ncbi:MAG TPA: hypothetical protein VEZ90_07205 [Blastocatellia bacterium]|nr:hypothetical protein [Blastocatellia bacterium]
MTNMNLRSIIGGARVPVRGDAANNERSEPIDAVNKARRQDEAGLSRRSAVPGLTGTLLLLIALVSMGTTASAQFTAGGGTWGTPGNNGKDLVLGPVSTQTCFLTGISGDFNGLPAINADPYFPGTGQPSVIASAEVSMEPDGFWHMRTRAGVGAGVMAHAMCINETTNRQTLSWEDNLASTSNTTSNSTANTHCFLTKVWSTTGLSGTTPSGKPFISLQNTGNQVSLLGLVNTIAGDADYGGAEAVCVDFQQDSHWTFGLVGPTNSSNSATTTFPLRNSFPNGAPVPVADVACGLTGVDGDWTSPNPDPVGWFDGVFVTNDVHVSPDWLATTSNGRRGSISCSGKQ